jgi:Fic family protein
LLIQLRDLWTHSSTAIEGNSLTLGETAFVLREGLTVAGKPLKDHQEVVGHARAIDLLWGCLESGKVFSEEELFALHKAVQTEMVYDYYQPIGKWKNEPNSTAGIVEGRQILFEYALPAHVPALMERWFALLHELEDKTQTGDAKQALNAYVQLHAAFVRIHPFADGNGRLARLTANLPVLRAGLPPVIIPRERRKDYIDMLAAWHHAAGQIKAGDALLAAPEELAVFEKFCEKSWQLSIALVEEARKRQEARNNL